MGSRFGDRCCAAVATGQPLLSQQTGTLAVECQEGVAVTKLLNVAMTFFMAVDARSGSSTDTLHPSDPELTDRAVVVSVIDPYECEE